MVFSSLLFIFRFLPAILIAYYFVPQKYKNLILFLGSLIFYAWGEPVYVCLLLFSTVVDYWHGIMIDRFLNAGKKKYAKCAVAASVIINLSLLGFFKYSDFILGLINGIFDTNIPLPSLALPIGISFYTFQTMSYSIDVYRRNAKVQKNIISFGAYVSMFPQLIAGPIVRYSTIAEELDYRKESIDEFGAGVQKFVSGLGKKVLIANNIGILWSEITGIGISDSSILMVWLGIFAFGMQIYFDFSGYSDMALGLGHMMGFHFPDNFNYPYCARSITDFWHRWHISLGTWFKEYVYIPLGGNRKGIKRQIINIMIVWLLTGIWHGAGLNFLAWGGYFGCLLLFEKLILKKWLEKLPQFIGNIYTLILVYIGWVFFAHDEIYDGIIYLKKMFGMGGLDFINARTIYMILNNAVLIIVCIFGSTRYPKKVFSKAPAIIVYSAMFFVLMIATAYLVDSGYNPFLYFRF